MTDGSPQPPEPRPGGVFAGLNRHWNWLRWPVAIAVLGLLLYQYRDGLAELIERRPDPLAGLAAVVLMTVGFAITFVRWHTLLQCQGLSISLFDAMRFGYLGLPFNYVAPGGVGGDLVRGVMVARAEPDRKTLAVTTIVVDRILGMMALFWVGLAAIVLVPTTISRDPVFQTITVSFVVGSVAAVFGLALMFSPWLVRSELVRRLEAIPRIGPLFERLLHSLELYQAQKSAVVRGLGLSVLGHLVMLTGFYWAGRAVLPIDRMPSLISHWQFAPPAQLVGALVPLPGGVGGLEGAFAFFYELAGSESAGGVLCILAFRAATLVPMFLGGVFYLASRTEIDTAIHDEVDLEAVTQTDFG